MIFSSLSHFHKWSLLISLDSLISTIDVLLRFNNIHRVTENSPQLEGIVTTRKYFSNDLMYIITRDRQIGWCFVLNSCLYSWVKWGKKLTNSLTKLNVKTTLFASFSNCGDQFRLHNAEKALSLTDCNLGIQLVLQCLWILPSLEKLLDPASLMLSFANWTNANPTANESLLAYLLFLTKHNLTTFAISQKLCSCTIVSPFNSSTFSTYVSHYTSTSV